MLSQMTMTLAEHHDERVRWRYRYLNHETIIAGEHDVERDVVQGEVVEGNDPQFPAGLPLVTLRREEVEEA